MNDPMTLTKPELLALKQPEQLFPGNLDSLKRVFRSLSRRWHPDMLGGDTEVFAHLAWLADVAEQRLTLGRWNGPCEVTFTSVSGRTRTVKALQSSDFVLGRQIITSTELYHLIEPAHKPFVERFSIVTGNFRFGSDRMRQECERYLPDSPTLEVLKDGRWLLMQHKTPDLLRLSDVVKYHGGELDVKAGAWIISSLMNLCCYLEYTKVVHGDISPDTYFISPKHHSGALLGGWFFAHPTGGIVKTLPGRTVNVAPHSIKVNKKATPLIDHELVRLVGRECFAIDTAPTPVKNWLNSIAQGSAREQYVSWMKALEAFGPRRFVKMPLTATEVYGASA